MINKLSEHLSVAEISKSQTALRNGIDNIPTEEHLKSLKTLAVELFEPLRSAVSADRGEDTPLIISSGYRSKELNSIIKGSRNSQHCKGQAIDLDLDGWYDDFDNSDLFYLILEEFDFDQLIWEYGDKEKPEWVHVSYVSKEKNRQRVTVASLENGKTVYKHTKA